MLWFGTTYILTHAFMSGTRSPTYHIEPPKYIYGCELYTHMCFFIDAYDSICIVWLAQSPRAWRMQCGKTEKKMFKQFSLLILLDTLHRMLANFMNLIDCLRKYILRYLLRLFCFYYTRKLAPRNSITHNLSAEPLIILIVTERKIEREKEGDALLFQIQSPHRPLRPSIDNNSIHLSVYATRRMSYHSLRSKSLCAY